MATLNIKNLPDALYRKLQAQARREHRSVSQEVTRLLSEALAKPRPVSKLRLKGLGKNLWNQMDAAEHVRKERTTWD